MKHKVSELEGALLAEAFTNAFDDAVKNGRTLAGLLSEIIEADKSEQAMRARFEGQPFTPRSLEDEAAMDAGRPWMANDPEGRLHLIAAMPAYCASKFGEEVELP